ncbi:MAG: methylaspartate mutase subunit E [Deltaproteobacteria bacterium]|nr:MAG: methylaspartate mutase subunit E [Deltaproteobacteria bacterium]
MITNKKLGDEFFDERKKVLAEWPTGREIDLEEAIAFHKTLPASKVWSRRLDEAKQRGETLIITGMGHTTLEQQIQLLKTVEPVADVLGTSVDSLTRNHDFKRAAVEIEKSMKSGVSTLNGFPVVNHGVKGVRKLVNAISKPIQLRYGAPDMRIINEIAFAGGYTADSGDGLYNFWNMNSKESLETVLKNHQYLHRLYGYYEERGAPISASVLGMYGCGVPPGLVLASALIQVLLMVEQGVREIILHYQAQGNLAQDVGAAHTFRKLAYAYMERFGYRDVRLRMNAGLSLAKYPDNLGGSFMVTFLDCLVARLCKAQLVDVRTISEAKTIPTKEDLVATYKAGKMAADLLKDQNIEVDHGLVAMEARILELEVRSIVEKVLELGDGDVAIGVVRAVEQGVLDNPFSSHRSVACEVMGVKDDKGALRYLNHGNLPLDKEVLEFHRERIAKRENLQGRKANYQTVVEDLASISKGILVGGF